MLRVLTYHRVAYPGEYAHLNDRLISATPEDFRSHLEYLKNEKQLLSAENLLALLETNEPLPEGSVVVTFDDAYRDIEDHAWPVLQKLQIPAILFVPTAFPDNPAEIFWWDRLHYALQQTPRRKIENSPIGALSLRTAPERERSLFRLVRHLKTWPEMRVRKWVLGFCRALDSKEPPDNGVLSWESLRRLRREGLAMAPHGVSHLWLDQLKEDQIRFEIRESIRVLKEQTGSELPFFCYPDGRHNETVRKITREEGVLCAFTTRDGFNRIPDTDPLALHRSNVGLRTGPFLFRLRLNHWFAHWDVWRRA